MLVALFAVVCTSAAKLDVSKPIAILRSAQSSNIDGSYSNRYAPLSSIYVYMLFFHIYNNLFTWLSDEYEIATRLKMALGSRSKVSRRGSDQSQKISVPPLADLTLTLLPMVPS